MSRMMRREPNDHKEHLVSKSSQKAVDLEKPSRQNKKPTTVDYVAINQRFRNQEQTSELTTHKQLRRIDEAVISYRN